MQKSGSSAEATSLIKQLPETKLNDWLLSDLARYYLEAGNRDKAREYAIKAVQANSVNLDAIALLQSINSQDSDVKQYTAEALLYNWKSAVQVKDEMIGLGQNFEMFGSLFSAAKGQSTQSANGLKSQTETEPYDPNVKLAPHRVTKYKLYSGGVTARLANSQEMANFKPTEYFKPISGITTTIIPDKIQPPDFWDKVYGMDLVVVKGYMTDLAIDNHCKWNGLGFTVLPEPYFRSSVPPRCSASITEAGTYSIAWLFLDQNKRVIGVDIYPGTIEVR
jgi:tetratricopeptide (TPR) repeat protein